MTPEEYARQWAVYQQNNLPKRNPYLSMVNFDNAPAAPAQQLDSLGGGKTCNSPLGCNPIETIKGLFAGKGNSDSGPIPPFNVIPSNLALDALGIAMDSRGLPTPLRLAKHMGGRIIDSVTSGNAIPRTLMDFHPANAAMNLVGVAPNYRSAPPPLRVGGNLLDMFASAVNKYLPNRR